MAKRNILVLAQHAPQARRLGVLLGDQYDVTGWDSLPESGEINADVVLATRLTAQEAVRLRCALLQIPGAGLDGIPLGALPPGCRVANVFGHEIPMAEYVVWAMLDHCVTAFVEPHDLAAGGQSSGFTCDPNHPELRLHSPGQDRLHSHRSVGEVHGPERTIVAPQYPLLDPAKRVEPEDGRPDHRPRDFLAQAQLRRD
jgi:hypothetical protein